jgi:hypothetical protein
MEKNWMVFLPLLKGQSPSSKVWLYLLQPAKGKLLAYRSLLFLNPMKGFPMDF